MIGRADLPREFEEWNRHHGAPFGRRIGKVLPDSLKAYAPFARLIGPFGFQPGNNATRRFEYPWAYHATALEPGMVAVDIGGGLAGFQFVLAKAGLKVFNVDPGSRAAMGWPVTPRMLERLNRAFSTQVELRSCFLQEANFDAGTVDRVFSISTLEHVPEPELPGLMGEVVRILRPGGLCVLTIDLFFDLEPFSDRTHNPSGRNINVRELVVESGLQMRDGDPAELNGYPQFDARRVLGGLYEFARGLETSVAQALVLEKPDVRD